MVLGFRGRFAGEQSGGVAVLFAGLFALLLGAAGLAVDTARVYQAQAELQAAADGAALAAAADPSTDEDDLAAVAGEYLSTNAPDDSLMSLTGQVVSLTGDSSTVVVDLTGSVPTLFMNVFGLPQMDIGVRSEVRRASGGPLDLVLAIDTTSSMSGLLDTGQTRRDALRSAAQSLVKRLMPSGHANVGLVSFNAGRMNVGKENRGKPWVDVPPDVMHGTSCVWIGTNCTKTNVPCVKDGVASQCPQISCAGQEKVCESNKVTSWIGCVTFRHGHLTSLSTSSVSPYPGVHGACTERLHDLSKDMNLVLKNFNSLGGGGETYMPSGLLWSWNLLESQEPFTTAMSAKEMAETGGRKALVLISDGANTLFVKDGVPTAQPAYEIVNGNWALVNPAGKKAADAETLTLCTNIKNDGIMLFTVALDIDDESAVALLRECASGSDKAFSVYTVSELDNAFGRIGQQLQSVRIVE